VVGDFSSFLRAEKVSEKVFKKVVSHGFWFFQGNCVPQEFLGAGVG